MILAEGLLRICQAFHPQQVKKPNLPQIDKGWH